MKRDRKYHYDEQNGIFVFDDEISVNWLVSQVLKIPGLQITKISNKDLQTFLDALGKSNLRMPNGQYCLYWLRAQINEKILMSESKVGEIWHQLVIRYRFIIEQIDQILISLKVQEFEAPQKVELVQREPNNIEAHFEPI